MSRGRVEPEPRGRALAKRLALTLGALVIALLGAELLVRALGLEPSRFAETRHLESLDKRIGLDLYPSDPDRRFPLDLDDPATRATWTARVPELDAWARRAPHGVGGFYSSELCRVAREGEELPPARAARGRVVLVGDSFIEGQGVPFERTVAVQLGAALEGVDVLACGRRGYDFTMAPEDPRGLGAWIGRHVLDADVVLYALTLNDPARSERFAAEQRYVDDWIVDRRRMLSHDAAAPPLASPRLLELVRDRLDALRIGAETTRWYRDMVRAPNAEGWSSTLAQLAALQARLADEGRTLVVAIWPILAALGSRASYPFTQTHQTIVAALTARGIQVVDTLDAFVGASAERLWVHPVDHHPNEEAQRRFTAAVLPALRAALARGAP